MKTSFRIISLIVSVCIVLSALPLIFSVTATESEPALPNRCEIVISQKGVNGDFGAKYNELASKTKITLSSTVDLSSSNNFELDIYVKDADALKSAITNSPGSGEQGLNLYFGSAKISALYATNNLAFVDITEQITEDGWNHIAVSKADFTEKSVNWANVKYIFLKFNDNITDSHTDLANTQVKLRNICSVISLPEISTGATVIFNDLIKNTLGENSDSLYSETANRFVVSDLEATNLSNCTHICIDFKVSDFEKFNSLIASDDISARLVLTTSNGNVAVNYDNLRAGSVSGWYNMIVQIGAEVTNGVTGFYFELVNTDNNSKLGDAYSVELSIANVYATDMSALDGNTLYGEAVTEFGVDNVEFNSGTYYKDFSVSANGEYSPLNDSEYIEFDLYVEDYEDFTESFEADVNLQLTVSNTADLSDNTLVWNNVEDKIVYGGWNHIILVVEDAANDGFDASLAVKSYKLEIVGVDKDNKTAYLQKIVKIDRLCATKYKTPDVANEYDKITDLSVNDRKWNMASNYANSIAFEYNMEIGADFSNVMFVEFDIYVQNYEAWKINMEQGNVTGITMLLSSATGTDYTIDSRSARFEDFITNSGWNHVCLPFGNFQKGSTSGWLDVSSITSYKIYYNGTTSASTGNLVGQYMAAVNINGTSREIPKEYMGENRVVAELNIPVSSGTYGANYSLLLTNSASDSVDFSDASFIEFDMYIEDYEAFVESFKTDIEGKTVGVNLNFGIGMTTNYADQNGYYEWNGIQDYIKKEGWNHITLAVDGKSRSNATPNGVKTLENIQCWKIWYSGDSYKKGEYINRIGDDTVIIANICATDLIIPELPDNVLAQIGTSDSATVGEYFHFTGDRLFEEKLDVVDFSKGTAIEFDIYIDDYEALLALEEASANNYSGLPYARNSRLALYFSSTPASLWSQYSAPRNYFCEYITLSDKITHSGWNHVVIGRGDFTKGTQTLDWANLTAWCIKFTNGSNVHPEVNPCPNVMVIITNIVNTGVVSNIPKDSDKDVRSDKYAVYISDAEALSDENGTWNPSSVYISNDYKNEGKGSIALDLNYKSVAEDANIYYLFDESADMSDLKALKFDFFIDLPQFIQTQGNKAEIVIANNRSVTDNYYKWNLDFSSLKSGWNSFDLDFNSAVKTGNPNLSEAKIIMLRFTELSIDATVFAEIVIGIDNLRYLSSTDSTTLKINSDSEDLSDNDFDNDIILDTDFEINDDISNEDIINKEPLIITSEPITKHIKNIKNLFHKDYKTAGIILGAEAVVLTAAVIIFMVVYRKKKKKTI